MSVHFLSSEPVACIKVWRWKFIPQTLALYVAFPPRTHLKRVVVVVCCVPFFSVFVTNLVEPMSVLEHSIVMLVMSWRAV